MVCGEPGPIVDASAVAVQESRYSFNIFIIYFQTIVRDRGLEFWVLGSGFWVRSSWFVVPDPWFLVPGSWFVVLVPCSYVLLGNLKRQRAAVKQKLHPFGL
jgi:hypothetical protein